ncbi:MAG TPA: site-specific integrase, partial [Actinomycetota bacterium]|nr:site-specific integrase [Actinomycetota bacterium]
MHPDFALLGASWELALRADGYAEHTVRSYRRALASLAAHLEQAGHGGVVPAELTRDQVRGWLV